MIENFSAVKTINLTKSVKKARENSNPAIASPGIDSNTENKKIRQYLTTIPGSENIRDKRGPKLDPANTCLIPIKANTVNTENVASKAVKNLRCFLMRTSSFSRPKRFIILENKPRGGAAEAAYSKDFSRLFRIYSNTNKGCILVHPLVEYILTELS